MFSERLFFKRGFIFDNKLKKENTSKFGNSIFCYRVNYISGIKCKGKYLFAALNVNICSWKSSE